MPRPKQRPGTSQVPSEEDNDYLQDNETENMRSSFDDDTDFDFDGILKETFSIPTPAPEEKKETPKASSKKRPQQVLIQPPMWSSKTVKKIDVLVKKSLTTISSASIGGRHSRRRKSGAGPTPFSELDTEDFLKKLSEQALEHYRKKEWDNLGKVYSTAIDRFPKNPDFYCNRSFAYQQLEYYGKALEDANKAIEVDPSYRRALFRRAAANIGLGKLLSAVDDYEELLNLCPDSATIRCKYQHCQRALNKCVFYTLISHNKSEHNIEDLVNINSIEVESSYQGPRIRDNKIQPRFINDLLKFYKKFGLLHRKFVYKILLDVKPIFKSVPSLLYLDIKQEFENLIICGDLHGRFLNLYKIIRENGFPTAKLRYLFNGNFVGRGPNSVEVALTLFAFKIVYPTRVFLARGHHECLTMNNVHGFVQEVRAKYGYHTFDMFSDIFNWLPLAHCINRKVLVLHGGLFASDGVTLEDIRNVKRDRQPGDDETILRDILWSDPKPTDGREPNVRGLGGTLFGPDITNAFLEKNHLNYIIRSHEFKPHGFEIAHGGKCITVFSTPNYSDHQNPGCYLEMQGPELTLNNVLFEDDPHPNPTMWSADSIFGFLTEL